MKQITALKRNLLIYLPDPEVAQNAIPMAEIVVELSEPSEAKQNFRFVADADACLKTAKYLRNVAAELRGYGRIAKGKEKEK